jgi:hypothetical protein
VHTIAVAVHLAAAVQVAVEADHACNTVVLLLLPLLDEVT